MSWFCTISRNSTFALSNSLGSRRWCAGSTRRGLLPPARFIPLAECTDLIQPLTDWVLNAAIHQQRLCQESGYDVSIAVNLSARSLRDPQLAHRFHAICQRWNVSPDRMICEITESGDRRSEISFARSSSHRWDARCRSMISAPATRRSFIFKPCPSVSLKSIVVSSFCVH